MNKFWNVALLLCAVLVTACTTPESWELKSKDNNVRFVLENKITDGVTDLTYSVYYKDTIAIERSLLGLIMDSLEYGKNAKFVSASPVKDIVEAYQLKSGKQTKTIDDCREQVFTFSSSEGNNFDLIVRVYNNGIAFRYGLSGLDKELHQFRRNIRNLRYLSMVRLGYILMIGMNVKSLVTSNIAAMLLRFVQNANMAEVGLSQCYFRLMVYG